MVTTNGAYNDDTCDDNDPRHHRHQHQQEIEATVSEEEVAASTIPIPMPSPTSASTATATTAATRPRGFVRNLVELPKAELHIHLEGAMRRTTLVELCAKYSITPVPPDTAHQRFEDFSAFVEVYIAACNCLREESDIYRLVFEIAHDLQQQNVTWVEIAPSLTFYQERFGGFAPTLHVLAAAAEAAEVATGVGFGFIISIERQLGVYAAEQLANIVAQQTQPQPQPQATATATAAGTEEESTPSPSLLPLLQICGRPAIVGFGLHGPEEKNPPSQFAKAFDIACGRSTNTQTSTLVSVPHAGEIAPSLGQGAQSVIDAVTLLRANRIGHGVLAYGNDAAMTLLENNNTNVCLDVCVSSNYYLRVVPSLHEHPLPLFLKKEIPCTINSDDPLLFGCTILSEYELCRAELQMEDRILAQCARYSFQYSCAPEHIKTMNIQNIDRWLASTL